MIGNNFLALGRMVISRLFPASENDEAESQAR